MQIWMIGDFRFVTIIEHITSLSLCTSGRNEHFLLHPPPPLFGAFCTLLVPKVNACNIVVKANVIISCKGIVALT